MIFEKNLFVAVYSEEVLLVASLGGGGRIQASPSNQKLQIDQTGLSLLIDKFVIYFSNITIAYSL